MIRHTALALALALAVLSGVNAFTIQVPVRSSAITGATAANTALQYSKGPFDAYDVLLPKPWKEPEKEEVVPPANQHENIFEGLGEDLVHAVFGFKKSSVAPRSLAYSDGPFDAYDVLEAKPWKKPIDNTGTGPHSEAKNLMP